MDREAMAMLREATDTLRKILEHLTQPATCKFCGSAYHGPTPQVSTCPRCTQPADYRPYIYRGVQ